MPTPYVAGSKADASGSTTCVAPITLSINKGDAWFVAVGMGGTGTAAGSLSDTQGNTYTLVGNEASGTLNEWLYQATDTVTELVAGTDSVTLTAASGVVKRVAVIGVPGLAGPAPSTDANGTGVNAGTSTGPTGTLAGPLSQRNDLVLAIEMNANAGSSIAWASGWTQLTTLHETTNQWLSVAYRTVSNTTGPVTANGTITSAAWIMLLAAFKQVGQVGQALLLSSNPSFETTTSPWTGTSGGILSRVQTWSMDGDSSLRLIGTAGTANPSAQSELLPVVAGRDYQAPLYVHSPQGWAKVQSQIVWTDGSGTPVGKPALSPTTSLDPGEAQQLVARGIAPTGASQARILVRMIGNPTQTVTLNATVGAYIKPDEYGLTSADLPTAIANFEFALGNRPITNRRVYFAMSALPGGLGSAGLEEDLAAGRLVLLSFKPDFSPTDATQRSQIDAFLSTCKGAGLKAKVALWHEPGLQGLTASQYLAMIAFYGPTVRNYYPLVYCHAGTSANDGSSPAAYYPGDANVDEIAMDFYASGYINHGYTVSAMEAIADAASPKKPFSLWEFGCNPTLTGQTDANITSFIQYIQNKWQSRYNAGKPLGDLCWFNATGQANNGMVLSDPTSTVVPGLMDTLYDSVIAEDANTTTISLHVDGIPRPPPTPPPPTTDPISTASFVFVRRSLPRMLAQNVLTGTWLHRDIPGMTQPNITRAVGPAGNDSFTCTLGQVRKDLQKTDGTPLFDVWKTAIYLEEDGKIKFGGILTDNVFNGNEWSLTCSGFVTYMNGVPYEGHKYSKTDYEALNVVRDLWSYIQSKKDGDLGLVLDSTNSGALVGSQTQQQAVTTRNAQTHQVTTQNKTVKIPFVIDWWNDTDIGQEIAQLAAEVPFEWGEEHTWIDGDRTQVHHRMRLGAPRIGAGRNELRFVEGENVLGPIQVHEDGTQYGNEVYGIGFGSGWRTLRVEVTQYDGHLRRPIIYTRKSIRRKSRMTTLAHRRLMSVVNLPTASTIIVRNHPHAPFGSFGVGDGILVEITQGWREGMKVWHRIMQTQQDPTTDIMTLTLLRSDSFSFLREDGFSGSF